MTKEASRPTSPVTTPPITAPKPSIADHVAPWSVFAVTTSCGSTTLPMAACSAASKKAPSVNWANVNTYTNHTWLASRTSKKPSTTSARSTSQTVSTVLRWSRPATTPASGEKMPGGMKRASSISPMASLLPVHACSNEYNAVKESQSPARRTAEASQIARYPGRLRNSSK